MFEKTDVVGENTNPLYRRLKEITGNAPPWNFYKYVIDRRGEKILCFGCDAEPEDAEIVRAIESML